MKKLKAILVLVFALSIHSYAQVGEINFNHQLINFSAAPRTNISPMSLKLWDSYNNGGPTSYGTILEIYGLSGHQTSQLNFGGWNNSRINYREAFYAQNTWSDWITLLDSKNDVSSNGNLFINGTGNHYLNGKLTIGNNTYRTIQGSLAIGDNSNYPGNSGWPGAWNSNLLLVGNPSASITFAHETNSLANIRYSTGTFYIGDNAGWGDKNVQTPTNTYLAVNSGNVGVGTTQPDAKLTVKGKIHAEEVKVDLNVPGPDYVFEKDYDLRSLDDVEKFISEKKHLPEIPSAKAMKEDGISMGEMQMKLLQKIEELTLYSIEQNKKLAAQNTRVELLEKALAELKNK